MSKKTRWQANTITVTTKIDREGEMVIATSNSSDFAPGQIVSKRFLVSYGFKVVA